MTESFDHQILPEINFVGSRKYEFAIFAFFRGSLFQFLVDFSPQKLHKLIKNSKFRSLTIDKMAVFDLLKFLNYNSRKI